MFATLLTKESMHRMEKCFYKTQLIRLNRIIHSDVQYVLILLIEFVIATCYYGQRNKGEDIHDFGSLRFRLVALFCCSIGCKIWFIVSVLFCDNCNFQSLFLWNQIPSSEKAFLHDYCTFHLLYFSSSSVLFIEFDKALKTCNQVIPKNSQIL